MSRSNNHFENFIKPTKRDWETAAAKEINGKSLESLNFPYQESINMPPIIFPDVKVQKLQPVLWRRNKVWQSGISFKNEVTIDKKDIEALINLDIKNFKYQQSIQNNILFSELKEKFPSCNWLLENKNEIIATEVDAIACKLVSSEHQDAMDKIICMMQKGIEILEQSGGSNEIIKKEAENIYFSREINPNYLYEIALGRAQRIIWRNILKAFKIENPLPPMFLSILTGTEVSDQFLIEATSKILSASIGGCDQINIEIQGDDTNSHLKNIIQIFNILKLEAGIGETIDPAAGSYYLDELTIKVANKIWTNLKS
jgi:hypothetical protein